MESLEIGNQDKGIFFRGQTSPAQTMKDSFAREKRIGGDRHLPALGKGPLHQGDGGGAGFGQWLKGWKNLIVKLVNSRRQIRLGQIESRIEIFTKNLFESLIAAGAGVHHLGAARQFGDEFVGRNQIRQVSGQFLKINRDERLDI